MNKLKKICIIEGVIIGILLILIVISIDKNYFLGNQVNTDSLKEFTIREQEVDGLEFKEISHVYGNSIGSKITVKVTNTSDEIYYLDGFEAIVKDSNGEELDTIRVYKYDELEPNESFEYKFTSDKDIVTNEDYVISFVPLKSNG